MVTAPLQFGPWTPDLPPQGGGITNVRNLYPTVGVSQGQVVYQPVPSPALFADASLPDFPRGAAVGLDGFQSPHVYIGTKEKLFTFDALARDWKDVSRPTHPYSSAAYERWRFAQFSNSLLATNYSDAPQYINMDLGGTFEDLTTLVRGRYITQHKQFIVMANTYDPLDGAQPSRIRWSAQGNPADWVFSQSTMADFQDWPDLGPIQGLVSQDDIYLMCRRGIARMHFVGAPWIFSFETVVSGKGVAYPESIVTVQGRTFFLDDDGFYEFNRGTATPIPIGIGKVNEFFNNSFNPSAVHTMTTVVDPRRNVILWTYASKASTGMVPDTTLVFNYQTGDWTILDAPAPYLFSSLSLATLIEDLAVYGDISNIPAPFDSPVWAGGVQVLWGVGIDGKIWIQSGASLQGIIDTAEIQLSSFDEKASGDMAMVQTVRPMWFGGGSALVTIGSRSLVSQPVGWDTPTTTSPVDGKAYKRNYARYHRIRLTFNGTFSKISGLEIGFVTGGSR
ncbi:hypothetical protein G6M86_20970 [Agrobacterium tumefaciens]|uniref:Phage protein n=1 Tax=Agrobacterium tumefaciens TaxID=358 RepID=A0AAJ4TC96_AGRTU|nr:hypothetical protein G6M86_20970 [Agrobacterium tumefaciens]